MTIEEAVALLERYSNYDGIGIPNLAGCKEAMKVAVDALKEAFIDSLSEEKPSEELEEAAQEYSDGEMMSGLAERAFIEGAKWHEQQMMKEAVEGKVFMSFAPGHNQMVMADVNLPTNTKVKLIIVKDND